MARITKEPENHCTDTPIIPEGSRPSAYEDEPLVGTSAKFGTTLELQKPSAQYSQRRSPANIGELTFSNDTVFNRNSDWQYPVIDTCVNEKRDAVRDTVLNLILSKIVNNETAEFISSSASAGQPMKPQLRLKFGSTSHLKVTPAEMSKEHELSHVQKRKFRKRRRLKMMSAGEEVEKSLQTVTKLESPRVQMEFPILEPAYLVMNVENTLQHQRNEGLSNFEQLRQIYRNVPEDRQPIVLNPFGTLIESPLRVMRSANVYVGPPTTTDTGCSPCSSNLQSCQRGCSPVVVKPCHDVATDPKEPEKAVPPLPTKPKLVQKYRSRPRLPIRQWRSRKSHAELVVKVSEHKNTETIPSEPLPQPWPQPISIPFDFDQSSDTSLPFSGIFMPPLPHSFEAFGFHYHHNYYSQMKPNAATRPTAFTPKRSTSSFRNSTQRAPPRGEKPGVTFHHHISKHSISSQPGRHNLSHVHHHHHHGGHHEGPHHEGHHHDAHHHYSYHHDGHHHDGPHHDGHHHDGHHYDGHHHDGHYHYHHHHDDHGHHHLSKANMHFAPPPPPLEKNDDDIASLGSAVCRPAARTINTPASLGPSYLLDDLDSEESSSFSPSSSTSTSSTASTRKKNIKVFPPVGQKKKVGARGVQTKKEKKPLSELTKTFSNDRKAAATPSTNKDKQSLSSSRSGKSDRHSGQSVQLQGTSTAQEPELDRTASVSNNGAAVGLQTISDDGISEGSNTMKSMGNPNSSLFKPYSSRTGIMYRFPRRKSKRRSKSRSRSCKNSKRGKSDSPDQDCVPEGPANCYPPMCPSYTYGCQPFPYYGYYNNSFAGAVQSAYTLPSGYQTQYQSPYSATQYDGTPYPTTLSPSANIHNNYFTGDGQPRNPQSSRLPPKSKPSATKCSSPTPTQPFSSYAPQQYPGFADPYNQTASPWMNQLAFPDMGQCHYTGFPPYASHYTASTSGFTNASPTAMGSNTAGCCCPNPYCYPMYLYCCPQSVENKEEKRCKKKKRPRKKPAFELPPAQTSFGEKPRGCEPESPPKCQCCVDNNYYNDCYEIACCCENFKCDYQNF